MHEENGRGQAHRAPSWGAADIVTGERLQALAEVTLLTRSILMFHQSLPRSGVREAVLFPGSHTALEPERAALARLKGRRSLFVYTHLLPSFAERILPHLAHRFVLLSHNSDDRVDERFRPLLDDQRLVHWFAQNATFAHPKLTPLPIGVANAQWPHGDTAALHAAAIAAPAERRAIVYCNFDIRTNPVARAPLQARLAASPLMWHAHAKPYAAYLADMAQCRWCLSPPGNGADCHRSWEALYLGTMPVVQQSPWGAPLHAGLPIIELDDLGAIDRAALDAAEHALAASRFDDPRLFMPYWRRRIAEKMAEAG